MCMLNVCAVVYKYIAFMLNGEMSVLLCTSISHVC